MEERQNVFTKAKELYKKINMAQTYLMNASEDSKYIKFAKIEIDDYYALLDDNSDAQINLKERFDILAEWKNKRMDLLETQFKETDAMSKHDLVNSRVQLNWTYQNERLLECVMNYDKYDLCKEETNVEL